MKFVASAKTALAIAAGLCFFPTPSALALTATANLAVSATVNANCTISTAPVAFGAYDPVVTNAAAALTGTGSVTIACTKNSAPNITLGLGLNPNVSVRRMINGAELLSYELYQPPNNAAGTACGALTQVWGTAGAAIFTPTSPGNTAGRLYNICGSVPGGQNVGVGSYADTVVATVNF